MPLRDPRRKPDDPQDSRGRWFVILFSLPFLLLGGAILVQSLGGPQLLGGALVPNWVLGLAGLVFFCTGLAFLFQAFGARAGLSRVAGTVLVLALAGIFHHGVFVGDLGSWSGTRIGSLSPGEVMRVIVVYVDILLLTGWILSRTLFAGGMSGPEWDRLKQADRSVQRLVGALFLGAPLAMALALHYTGALDRIGAYFDQPQRGLAQHGRDKGPTRALGDYAGWWDGGHSMFGAGWVTRVIVRVDDGNAYLRLWHSCPPGYCDEGEFKAKIHGTPPGRVRELEVTRLENGITRTIRLGPNGEDPNMLAIIETRIRGKDWNTNQQSLTGLGRVK